MINIFWVIMENLININKEIIGKRGKFFWIIIYLIKEMIL